MQLHRRSSRIIFILFVLLVLFLNLSVNVTPVSAVTIVVDTLVDENINNSDCSLREAIIAANTGFPHYGCDAGSVGADTITLPAGIYTLSSQIYNIDSEIVINGAGAETTIIEASPCNPVTLPGDCPPANYRIFTLDDDSDLTLNNLTLRHGVGIYGGAINCDECVLNITDSTLSGNFADSVNDNGIGGAILIYPHSTVVFSGSTITGNKSEASGGGIYNEGSLTLTNTIVHDNGSPTDGGGIYNFDGTLEISGGTISDNESTMGGGISNGGEGTANISDCTITGNTTSSYGGGIDNKAAVTLTDSTLSENTASYGGGIHNYIDAYLSITSCTLTENEVETDGGGIYNFFSDDFNLINSTLSGNTAGGKGGGIHNCSSSTVNLTNNTLSGNSASSGGGGIYNNGILNSYNTIVAYSTGGDCLNDGSIGAHSQNIIQDDSCSAAISGDPKLDILADNGGPTKTHALLSSSFAIDHGNPTHCPTTDQRGVSRPQGAECDIGAYEKDLSYLYLPLILKQ